MKTLLLSTAALGLAATGALAQDLFRGELTPNELRASDLIGTRIYAAEAATDAAEADGVQDGWEDIGEINDLLVSREGSVEAVLVDIGGFLGVGERQVAVDMSALRFVADSATGDDANDYFLVLNADRAALEGAPDYGALMMGDQAAAVEQNSAELSGTDAAAATTAAAGAAAMTEGEADAQAMADAATAEADAQAASADAAEAQADAAAADVAAGTDMAAGATATRTPIAREGYVAAGAELTADQLEGAAVYDGNDERIGEVGELVLTPEGQVNQVVIDVGGFLGIGEKPVALPMDQVDILRQDGGDDLRVYLPQTKEELDALPRFEAPAD